MMRPHPAMDVLATDGTAAIVGIAMIVIAIVVAVILEARHDAPVIDPVASAAPEDDADLWVFP